MNLDLYNFKLYIIDGTYVEIYDFGAEDNVWEGYIEDLPDEYENRIVSSIETNNNHLVINIEEE